MAREVVRPTVPTSASVVAAAAVVVVAQLDQVEWCEENSRVAGERLVRKKHFGSVAVVETEECRVAVVERENSVVDSQEEERVDRHSFDCAVEADSWAYQRAFVVVESLAVPASLAVAELVAVAVVRVGVASRHDFAVAVFVFVVVCACRRAKWWLWSEKGWGKLLQ